MLSLKYISENQKIVKKSLKAKNIKFNINDLLTIDKQRKSLITEVEVLKSKRNLLNKKISDLKKHKKDTSYLIEEMKVHSISIKKIDSDLNTILLDLNDKLLYVPNIMHESVPIGDESKNVIVREWGEKPKFDFEIKSHKVLCEVNKLVDTLDLYAEDVNYKDKIKKLIISIEGKLYE